MKKYLLKKFFFNITCLISSMVYANDPFDEEKVNPKSSCVDHHLAPPYAIDGIAPTTTNRFVVYRNFDGCNFSELTRTECVYQRPEGPLIIHYFQGWSPREGFFSYFVNVNNG